MKNCDCVIIYHLVCVKWVIFACVNVCFNMRHWASWSDKPLSMGHTVKEFNLELSTKLLLIAVPRLFWILLGKYTVCDKL